MGKINVSFKGEIYISEISVEDFNYYKRHSPMAQIQIKGFGNSELSVPAKDLILIGPNTGNSLYTLRTYTGPKKGTQ